MRYVSISQPRLPQTLAGGALPDFSQREARLAVSERLTLIDEIGCRHVSAAR
jgi:hypothetical protein